MRNPVVFVARRTQADPVATPVEAGADDHTPVLLHDIRIEGDAGYRPHHVQEPARPLDAENSVLVGHDDQGRWITEADGVAHTPPPVTNQMRCAARSLAHRERPSFVRIRVRRRPGSDRRLGCRRSPLVWQQLVDARGWVDLHAEQHVGDVLDRVHLVRRTCRPPPLRQSSRPLEPPVRWRSSYRPRPGYASWPTSGHGRSPRDCRSCSSALSWAAPAFPTRPWRRLPRPERRSGPRGPVSAPGRACRRQRDRRDCGDDPDAWRHSASRPATPSAESKGSYP